MVVAAGVQPVVVGGVQLVGPYALSKHVEPYKGSLSISGLLYGWLGLQRVLGILLRPSCVSLSVSNEYLSLAQPLGAFLLRDGPPGRVPQRTLARMLAGVAPQLSGVVLGCEHVTDLARVQSDEALSACLREVLRTSSGLGPAPPLLHAWWDRWDVHADASCRVQPPEPAPLQQAAGASDGRSGAAAPGGQVLLSQQPVCSMATLFLQHYLDSLGALNTFG